MASQTDQDPQQQQHLPTVIDTPIPAITVVCTRSMAKPTPESLRTGEEDTTLTIADSPIMPDPEDTLDETDMAQSPSLDQLRDPAQHSATRDSGEIGSIPKTPSTSTKSAHPKPAGKKNKYDMPCQVCRKGFSRYECKTCYKLLCRRCRDENRHYHEYDYSPYEYEY